MVKKMLTDLPIIPPGCPVLIAGPTASGKSELALEIAQRHGGVIVNADASQVYDCWRVITARPSAKDESIVPHRLFGHVPWDASYSTGHWLRDVTDVLKNAERPIITGGTGLYFMALTQGLTNIPAIPSSVRARGDALTLQELQQPLDMRTRGVIDMQNRARVQRAWEVQTATDRGLADWQAMTPPPILPVEDTVSLVFDVDKDWLVDRINRRFSVMLEQGALDEVAAMLDRYDPTLPSCKAIGVPDLVAHLRGQISLDEARSRTAISTRQFAKRQRTWFRSKMRNWHKVQPHI